jgi:hypothetical protein
MELGSDRSFTRSGTEGAYHANVPHSASDLDYAQLPLRWLASLDVSAP